MDLGYVECSIGSFLTQQLMALELVPIRSILTNQLEDETLGDYLNHAEEN